MYELDRATETREIGALREPDVLAFVQEPAARRAEETGQESSGRGLPAAALTDQTHRLAPAERERYRVDGRDGAGRRRERSADVVELDQCGHASFSATGTSAFEPSTSATCFQRMQAA